jgi:ectoine hydroxylase
MDQYPSRKTTNPSILERRDPIVYRPWEPNAPLSAGQVTAYERDGYISLEGIFDPAEIEVLCEESARLRSQPTGNRNPETSISEPDSGAVRSVFRVHEHSSVFARLAADARVAEVARFLLDDDVYLHQSRLNYKPGFEGREFFWHSDFETWHVEDGMPRMRALSMAVLLTENTPHNGPLMLIPGSHRHFVSCVGETPEEHFRSSLRKQEYGVPDRESLTRLAEEGGIDAPLGPAGTVLLFDCNTMHGSGGNITPFPRSNAFIVYNAVSNQLAAPFGPKASRPEFIAARHSIDPIVPTAGSLLDHAA